MTRSSQMIEHYAGRNAEPGPELFSGVLDSLPAAARSSGLGHISSPGLSASSQPCSCCHDCEQGAGGAKISAKRDPELTRCAAPVQNTDVYVGSYCESRRSSEARMVASSP